MWAVEDEDKHHFTTKTTTVIVEAEMFWKRGGWVLDQQFMDQMGSPFLLAHGLGRPVEDAAAEIRFPETGKYRMWVRTRDWVAPWKNPTTPEALRAEGNPGIFQVKIDGEALPTTFGNEEAEWHWQEGGWVEIKNETISIVLHDLTGFEGRCDAILFSKDQYLQVPPNVGVELDRYRRRLRRMPERPTSVEKFDFDELMKLMKG